jgi:hypothetical protein
MPLNSFKSFLFISVHKNYDEWSVVNALERKSGVKNGTSFLDHLKSLPTEILARQWQQRKKLCKRWLWRNDHFRCTRRFSHVNFCHRSTYILMCSLKLIRRIVRPQIWLYLFSIINKGCIACAILPQFIPRVLWKFFLTSLPYFINVFLHYVHCYYLAEVVVPKYKLFY